MINFEDMINTDSKGNCDECGSDSVGKINGNELCEYHMNKYRNKNAFYL